RIGLQREKRFVLVDGVGLDASWSYKASDRAEIRVGPHDWIVTDNPNQGAELPTVHGDPVALLLVGVQPDLVRSGVRVPHQTHAFRSPEGCSGWGHLCGTCRVPARNRNKFSRLDSKLFRLGLTKVFSGDIGRRTLRDQ